MEQEHPRGLHSGWIEEAFRKYYKGLCLYSYGYVNDFDVAEDIVQNVFVKMLAPDRTITVDNPKTYLYTSVRNASINWLSKKRPMPSTMDEEGGTEEKSSSPEEEIIRLEQRLELYKAIDTLPEQCRRIFLSVGMNEQKYREVADEMGLSINTIKDQMKKAYRILRGALKDIYSFF